MGVGVIVGIGVGPAVGVGRGDWNAPVASGAIRSITNTSSRAKPANAGPISLREGRDCMVLLLGFREFGATLGA